MEVNEPAVAYVRRKYSVEEYLEFENTSEDKHEYYQGEIFAMAGTKMQHAIVTGNLYHALRKKLDGKPCQPLGSDIRIYIKKNTLFTYPDVSVICGEPISLNNDDMNFVNPTVIFEVLSAATRDYDSNAKFELYKAIPTLKEYILVEPETISVKAHHLNNKGYWQLKEYNDIDQVLELTTINVSVDLREVYERTKVIE
jgi:Uma2 family endonuclease